MCNTQKLTNEVYQFDGFSFYNSWEQPNYWLDHGHEEIQITLPQANSQAWIKCQSLSNRQSFKQIEPGQAFLVSQNQSHQLEWRQPAELTLIYLHPSFLASAINDSIENNHLEIRDHFSLINDTLIREVGVIFRHLCNSEIAVERLYIENLANLLAVHLLGKYLNYNLKPHSYKKLSQQKLKRIYEYIEINLDRKITLSDLAKIAGVGKFYFCRLFKTSVDLTPYQYVLQQRVERAKRLLRHSNLPICDISLECGFSSQSHLTKHFRNMVNSSPMNYRKSREDSYFVYTNSQ